MKTSSTSQLCVIYRPIGEVNASPRNARTHSRRQIRQIADSIKAFGFTNPVLIDSSDTVIAGHGRVRAAKLLGMSHVPTITLADLSPDQLRAYIIADNKLAEKAGWDNDLLKIELGYLLTLPDLDVTITGFEVGEIDLILQEDAEEDEEESAANALRELAVTTPGDLWLLGPHRILCGSSLDPASYRTLMESDRADVVFVDPPYNVAVDGHVCGNGSIQHREFAMASGEMTEAEFVVFLTTSLRLLADHSKEGSVHFVCMDWQLRWPARCFVPVGLLV
jgi:ParB-like nuclease domain